MKTVDTAEARFIHQDIFFTTMPTSKTAPRKAASSDWDAPENEAKNSFVGFNEIGDKILGTLLSAKQVDSTLEDKKGEKQWIYEIKVRECSYHVLDDKKRVIAEPVEPSEGEIVSVGGRKMIDSRMARIKIGQVVGLKFTGELPPLKKGHYPTKLIKVFTPKGRDGEFEMDEEVVAAHAGDDVKEEVDKF